MLPEIILVLALAAGTMVLAPPPVYAGSCEHRFWSCHGGAMEVLDRTQNLTGARIYFDACMDAGGC